MGLSLDELAADQHHPLVLEHELSLFIIRHHPSNRAPSSVASRTRVTSLHASSGVSVKSSQSLRIRPASNPPLGRISNPACSAAWISSLLVLSELPTNQGTEWGPLARSRTSTRLLGRLLGAYTNAPKPLGVSTSISCTRSAETAFSSARVSSATVATRVPSMP